ncbi:hypothetical protein FRT60_26885 [Pseudomonas haemolytica]|uniref:Uncharacterized protein n=1 Tax=Pseudomonas haemolytica TaxID=2600065 RepID=A0A646P4H2_9PSED|nr:hypothetical protein [Pseudomonas haemolytica]
MRLIYKAYTFRMVRVNPFDQMRAQTPVAVNCGVNINIDSLRYVAERVAAQRLFSWVKRLIEVVRR